MNHVDVKEAADLWANGKPLEAGRLIYESLPLELRPGWASRILRLVLDRSKIQSSEIDDLLIVADNKPMWKDGHKVFDRLRNATLELDDLRRIRAPSVEESLQNYVLSLAELVAKVVYNATTPPDEFDEESGWRIAAYLRWLVDRQWPDEAFERQAWEVLSSV